MESINGRFCQRRRFSRAWTTLLYVVLLASAPPPLKLRAWAQSSYGVTTAMPLRVENETGVGVLRAAANCTDGDSLEVDWAGNITLDAPVMVASGMFLSITGEDSEAEVHGGSQTRMFEVYPGGRLTLTQLKLSGGNEASGGAIYSNSSALILDSCVFQGNAATNGSGGAVWAEGGNITILGGEFLGNIASQYGGAVGVKGAIATLVVDEGSMFDGNTALVGGALYCGGVGESGLARCSLNDTDFTSNNATAETEGPSGFLFLDGVKGGGAVAFWFASANVTYSVFSGNHALNSGGALLGGNGTDIMVNGCNFESNTAVDFGGAIAAASMTLGGNTQLTSNIASSNDDDMTTPSNDKATSSGGAVFGWDSSGTIIFNDVVCTNNMADGTGGCLYSTGRSSVNNGTVMLDNEAYDGGCIYGYQGCEINIFGGYFMCQCDRRGGFLNVGGNSSVKITGGVIENNVARRRAGAIYCDGRAEPSTLTIEGGLFKNNSALESGGVIATRGSHTSVNITGGTFSNNNATFYGGFVFLEEGASLKCENATIRDNYAGDQGGGIYARSSTWVNSSCDLIGNQSPQGAALYLTGVKSVNLENHEITDDAAFSGSVVYMTTSSVIATGVTFRSDVGLQEDSTNRAVQSDSVSTLTLVECVFDGWLGDTVIYHRNPDADSLVLDSCDFSGSSAAMVVTSLNSDAKIRNAIVGDYTSPNAGGSGNSLERVNRALNCASPNVCGPGKCVNSTLGVLCECLDADNCLNDGGEVSLSVNSRPPSKTLSPNTVSFELLVSSEGNGTTYSIWRLTFEAKYLNLDVVPSSGMLRSGGNVTVAVTGAFTNQGLGGNLTSSFNLTSVGSANSISTPGVPLEVASMFYLCDAYQYAVPPAGENDGVSCKQCSSVTDAAGVNCENPGATLAALPIRPGYWRSSNESLMVHECFHSGACAGNTEVSYADEYCEVGYKGPYCAVCSKYYGRGVSNTCHSCKNTEGQLLTWAGVIFSVVIITLLGVFAVVFLVGGLDAVDIARKSVTRTFSVASMKSMVWSVSQTRRLKLVSGGTKDSPKDTIAPACDFTWESTHRSGKINTGHSGRESSPKNLAPDGICRAYVRPCRAVVEPGTNIGPSGVPARRASDVGMLASDSVRLSTVADVGLDGALVNRAEDGAGSKCCGVSISVKVWASRLPLDKLKILVVVWQILTLFSRITDVEFPTSYAIFLSWIDVVNLDIGHIFSASCVLPSVDFYERLLVTTLVPLILAVGLLFTYNVAKCRAGIGSAGVIAKRAAWSRHVAAGLLLSFLVFTSASTLVFNTFACDNSVGGETSYLRADYSISCKSSRHRFFKGYAILMILVYPIGVPVLYAVILWNSRELLNPLIHTGIRVKAGESGQATTRDGVSTVAATLSSFFNFSSNGPSKNELSQQELQEFNETVRARRDHPELIPSMFLWKDFGPDFFYYEVVECGRRMLLTGVLIFVKPHSSMQVATACIFAFGSLVGFELMRPYLDPTDACLYRLGCVVIFLSNFLALLIKVDAVGEDNEPALGRVLVAVNVLLALAVLFASWFAVQQSVDDSRDDENTFTLARAMLTAEQHAANIIQNTRDRSANISSSATSVGHHIPPRGPSTNGYQEAALPI